MEMEGQVAMVTGGAMGIGKAFVGLLISRKVKVCIADVVEDKAQTTIDELTKCNKEAQVIFQRCDVSHEDQIEDAIKKTIEKFGKIDIIVNNAGISNEAKYREMMSINMNGVINGTMLGIKYLSKNSGGSGGNIINMASLAALMSVPLFPVYAATKHAILGFTRSIGALSLSKHGIRINCICPSFVDTQMSHNAQTNEECCLGTKEEMEEAMKEFAKHTQTMQPEGVVKCLVSILDNPTLTGTAVFCSTEYAQEILKMPDSVDEAYDFYIPKKK